MAKDPEKTGASREVGPRYSDPFGMFRAEMDRLLKADIQANGRNVR
jgi:hypothetical protein